MKKTVFLLALLGLFYSTCLGAEYAVDKGANMFSIIGGYVNASGDLYENGGSEAASTFFIMPSVAHFSPANFAIGTDLFFLYSGSGDDGLVTLGLGPKAMYFLGGKEDKTYPYFALGIYYFSIGLSDGRPHYSAYGTRVKFGGGINTMIASHWGLLIEVSYNIDNLKSDNHNESASGNMMIISMGLAGFTF
jgi:hypothetical protein